MSDHRQRIFAALGDQTRREIIEILSIEGDKTATDLTQKFSMSRQGISKHLGVLSEAELVTVRRVGRETIYTLNPSPLDETTNWVASINMMWDKRLESLRDFLTEEDTP